MAPIKFEENIKDKLEQREIKPSLGAWSKLSQRLDDQPEKGSRKAYWWLGMAASFVGLLIVASVFFNKNPDNAVDTQTIVIEDVNKQIETEEESPAIIILEQTKKETQVAEEQIKTEPIKTDKNVLNKKKLIIKSEETQIVLTQENLVLEEAKQPVANQESNVVSAASESKTIEQIKIDEVAKQILKLKEEKMVVTDAEIDNLLKQAEKELIADRLYNDSTKTVDAELLLMQVETDSDQSFRNKVFEVIKSSYKKVKTAVAERNN